MTSAQSRSEAGALALAEVEVELTGVLGEFREALRDEIEAARRNAQSSAVQLVHGERIGRSADGHQYLFRLENAQLALPDDLPGDLYVPGRDRVDATVISIAGTALTLSVREDLGQHVPSARLSSNLTNLLRALILRIEEIAVEGRPTPAGDRLLGTAPVAGEPLEGLSLEGLNPEQKAAVASGLGRDTTFIQGPPGTGKTKTIGTLGEQLAGAGRSVLLVSHTNTAVDQALLHIARAVDAGLLAEGKVLRLGEPKDERVIAQPDLLVKTHVERRSANLVARRDVVQAERAQRVARINEVEQLLALCDWADGAEQRQSDRELAERERQGLRERADDLAGRVADQEADAQRLYPLQAEARAAVEVVERAHTLDREAIPAAHQALEAAQAGAAGAAEQAEQQAEAIRREGRSDAAAYIAGGDSQVREAEEQRDQHRADLDQARQVRLLADRFAQLPSLAFTRSRVDALLDEVKAAEEDAVAADRSHREAKDLLEEAQSAGAVTRGLRRLPKPHRQAEVVEATLSASRAAQAQAAATAAELATAQEQLAETERLRAELDKWREFPLVEECEARLALAEPLVAQAEEERTRATAIAADLVRTAAERADAEGQRIRTEAAEQLSLAEEALGPLEEERELCAEQLRSFTATHGEEPTEVLSRVNGLLAALEDLRRERDDAVRASQDAQARLASDIESERARLAGAGLPATSSSDLAASIAHLGERVAEGLAAARQYDAATLRQEATELREGIRRIDNELASIEEQLQEMGATVVREALVLATTLTRAYLRDEVQHRRFDTVVLDEASMAPIPALWAAAAICQRNLVVVGDPHQLPPIAQAADDRNPDSPASRWLARDAFEVSGVTAGAEHLVKLRTQYRMHPAISAAPNALVYGGELRDGPGTDDDRDLDPWYVRDWGHDAPVLLIDTEKTDAWCTTVDAGGRSSRLNFLSATVAVDLAEMLLREDRPPAKGGEARILIATPYRPQARLLTMLLRDADLEGEVVAGTVHSFQGSEAPIVIYDLVVDEPHRRAGLFAPRFDDDQRRQFNVGLTRAKHRLYVIGDFKFLQSHGKKAFIGTLLQKLRSAPCVDADSVVPLGLAARSAAAHLRAYGPEGAPDRAVVTQRDFDPLFLADLDRARERIVIYSPFITQNRLEVLAPHLKAAVERGVRVYVVTKSLSDRTTDASTYRDLMRTLTQWGVIVVPKKAMHEKLVFVDDDTLWSGSLNPLSFRNTREVMERRRSRKVADDYRRTLQLDVAFSAYEAGEIACPICGSEMALAEGSRGTYRRCVVPHCYSRGLTDPPLKDGKMCCHTCGGELYYGTWGEAPHWRCHDNAHHRMRVHQNHLQLPEMRRLISAKELSKLQTLLGGGEIAAPQEDKMVRRPVEPAKSDDRLF